MMGVPEDDDVYVGIKLIEIGQGCRGRQIFESVFLGSYQNRNMNRRTCPILGEIAKELTNTICSQRIRRIAGNII